jgi:tetratricopeptide (TPR) repeat protein
MMADDRMLQEAIEAVSTGQSERARDLLTRLLRANQSNPRYWLWMSSVVDTTKERIYCLQKVLHLDPDNRAAQLGMVIGGISPPDEGLQPVPITPRNWKETYRVKSLDSGPKKYIRRFAYFGAFILVFGLISIGILAPRMKSFGYFGGIQLTVTPIFETIAATATLLPTNTPRVVTPTPTFIGPTPLWMLLEATYTPTPLYVNTPHPVTEAYRAGIRAFTEGNYEEMLMFMQQATRAEAQSADIYYYIGEANLLLEEPDESLFAFEKAIETNPNFAPAYFGRAKAMLALDPEFDIEADLTQAIVIDPSLASAHLELIAYYLLIGNYELALNSLEIAEGLIPESPLIYAYRSQALLQIGEFELALEAAQQAYELDQTILDVYQTLGNLHLMSGDAEQASHYLEIYLRYVTDDANAWAAYGRALFDSGDQFDEAMQAFDLALELDENSFTALLFRGLSYVEAGQGQLAVNDLFIARNFDRKSFVASLGLARALSLAERYDDAISQFTGSEQLASTELQRAEVYYWRANTFRLIGDKASASIDYKALLALPAETIPIIWVNEAQKFILELTPTPTMTPSPLPATSTPTIATPTLTPTKTSTPTVPTPTPTITQSPTSTKVIASPTATPRPYQTPQLKD